ncbi:MAG: RNA polymerase sigma factor [Kiritimatiellae bacterium]|nr:RNA polymerase sigma factor [Kiritimatiellia bacterium]
MTLARRFCTDEGDAEELVNRTFAAVVEGIDDYLEQSAFFGWMCQILSNIHAKDIRKKSHGIVVYPGVVPDVIDEDAEDRIFQEIDASLLHDAIENLPKEMQEAIVLHYFTGLSVQKIAKFLAIPEGTVKSRLHYARLALGAKLGANMKKPGGKTVLLALLLCGLTALGAAVWNIAASSGKAQTPADASTSHVASRMSSSEAEASGQATSDMQQTEASDISTFQPFNFSTDFSGEQNMNISRTTRAAAMLAAATLSTGAATANAASTYTWLATPEGSRWNTVQQNWSDGTTSGVRWVDDVATPNDAVFSSPSSQQTIYLYEGHHAGNMTIAAPDYRFEGSGPLTVHGTLSVSNDVMLFTPLGGSPQIDIVKGAWLKLGTSSADAEQRITGRITGECTPTANYPTNTHVLVHGSSKGDVIIDSGASVTNDAGTLSVRHSLSIQSGTVRVSAGLGPVADDYRIVDGGKTPLFVCGPGDGGYENTKGVLFVAPGGTLATPEETWSGIGTDKNGNDWFAQAQQHAQVEIHGNVTMPNVEYINAYGSPARLTVGDGGTLTLCALRLSQTKNAGVEVNLNDGGTLRLRQFTIAGLESGTARFCALNLNGGVVYPLPLKSGGSFKDNTFLGIAGSDYWTNVTVNVLDGGARFSIPERTIFCNLPMKHGTDNPTAYDGGLTVDGCGESNVFVLNAAGSDYHGATVVKGGCSMQVRIANALPSTTSLRVGAGSEVSFNQHDGSRLDIEQTIAQVEGTGRIANNSRLVVTSGIAPAFEESYGVLSFGKPCSIAGTLEITGDANGCGCVKFESAGQSIADLTLHVASTSTFSKENGKAFYKIVDAPNGFPAGGNRFAAEDIPGDWNVRYEADAVYLQHLGATVISLR